MSVEVCEVSLPDTAPTSQPSSKHTTTHSTGEQHQLLAAAHLELLQLLLGLFAELPAPPGPAADEEQQQQSNTRQTADSDSARNK